MPEESKSEYLNRMGGEGWELVGERLRGGASSGTSIEFTFKRMRMEMLAASVSTFRDPLEARVASLESARDSDDTYRREQAERSGVK